MRTLLRWLAAAIAAVCLCLPLAATAQIGAGLDSIAPTVSIIPGTNNASVDSVVVYVYWTDNQALDATRRIIEFNGVEVQGSFTYTGSSTSATSVGVVHLTNGTNVVLSWSNPATNSCGSNAVFRLQAALVLNTNPAQTVWTSVTNVSPYTTPKTNTTRFFRLISP